MQNVPTDIVRQATLVARRCLMLSGSVDIESIRHKALRNFAETGRPKGLPGNLVGRLRNMLAFLATIESVEELKLPPSYGAHELTGDRAGDWSLTVTKNWRMTFRINSASAIEDMDLEDNH